MHCSQCGIVTRIARKPRSTPQNLMQRTARSSKNTSRDCERATLARTLKRQTTRQTGIKRKTTRLTTKAMACQMIPMEESHEYANGPDAIVCDIASRPHGFCAQDLSNAFPGADVCS